jgi:hypothetical protein
MKRFCTVLVALFSVAIGGGVWAADAPVVSPRQLAGNTLSAVAFVARTPGMPGGGELARVVIQAYLRPDGTALVRAWDTARNAYTVPAERRWSLSGSTFCLDSPVSGANRLCADIHIWGPRIAGVGAQPYAMLDGDLQPGNALGAGR